MIRKPRALQPQPIQRSIPNNVKTSMLGNNMEIRSNMVTLKKILYNDILVTAKNITTKVLRHGAWLAFSGIDALNLNCTGKNIHISFVEMVLIPAAEAPNFKDAIHEICNALLAKLNENILQIANLDSAHLTKNILEKASNDGLKSGKVFVANLQENRATIDFLTQQAPQPFIEIRVLSDFKTVPLERYGIKFLSLGDVERDINKNLNPYGESDWNIRKQTYDQAIIRPELTITLWSLKTMLKICFPAYAMRKLGSSGKIKSDIEFHCSNKPQLKEIMHKELAAYDQPEQIKNITLVEFVNRASQLNLISNNEKFKQTVLNEYNENLLYEIKTELTG